MTTLDELKEEATELGINFSPNIGEAKLKDKIEEFYKSKEELPVNTDTQLEVTANSESTAGVKKIRTLQDIIAQSKAEAKVTKVVTIIDNDQRVNNHTTTCTVNCSNEHFDLGTRIIPLNERVEVEQGFIDTLREVKIPQHSKDPKTGLSKTVVRPRYTVSVG